VGEEDRKGVIGMLELVWVIANQRWHFILEFGCEEFRVLMLGIW
jgi:hypothetical protein